ncbi:hypothetical protein Tco_0607973 [Tanacetum coccineum]
MPITVFLLQVTTKTIHVEVRLEVKGIIEDIISIGSFMEVFVLNQYVLVRKYCVIVQLIEIQDEGDMGLDVRDTKCFFHGREGCQVKDDKIYLLVQQYEQFTILEDESIDSDFARFNTIVTSLKALDEGFSSNNYIRKFLRAPHPKWRANVTAIEESKDLSSLALDELIGNLKVHEVIMEKDSKIYKGKKERVNSIALKVNKESSDDETSTSGSDDEEYAMAIRNFKKFLEERPLRNKEQMAFVRGSWSDSENKAEEKTNEETCLMAQSSNEVTLDSSYFSDNASFLDDDSMQIEYNNLCKKLERNKEIDIECESPSSKVGLGFDKNEVSTSGTMQVHFVRSAVVLAGNGSTIKVDGSTIPGFFNPSTSQNEAKSFLSPHVSSRSDYVIVRKKLIHENIENSKRPPLKSSLKNGLGFVKTECRPKTPPPRRNNSSQPRYNTPQPRKNSSGPHY